MIASALAELFARAFYPAWAPRTGRITDFWKHDSDYGWAHKPGHQGRFVSHGFDISVRTNSHGFRGPERSFEKSSDIKRVVVLGDSFVWGFGVEEKDTFAHLLEEHFAGSIEVINLGVSGYSTDQELLLYKNFGWKFKPDLVIVVVAENDVSDNSRSVVYVVYRKPLFRLEGDRLTLTNTPVPEAPLLEHWIFHLARQSYVLNALNRVRESWSVGKTLRHASVGNPPATVPSFPGTPAEELTTRLLFELGGTVKLNNAKFTVALVEGFDRNSRVSSYLESKAFDVIHLGDHISADDESTHLKDDFHWNPKGHRVVFNALVPLISQKLRE
jgi:lysophospholipase L1-like esterase